MRLPAGDSELVQIVDASLADAARLSGEWLVCRLGCTQCCYGAFAINALDVLRLRAGMEALKSAEPDRSAGILRRAQAWIAEYSPGFPGDAETGLLGDSEQEQFDDFANEAPCPALDPATGRCDVYAWRPMTCRVFGPPVRMDAGTSEVMALGHCELCFAGASESDVARCEMPVPHELEARLLDEIAANSTGARGETVVAFALVR
jgi:Fe-S-cluster containining protein